MNRYRFVNCVLGLFDVVLNVTIFHIVWIFYRSLEQVSQTVANRFMSIAEGVAAKHGSTNALAAAIAVLSGFGRPKSLITAKIVWYHRLVLVVLFTLVYINCVSSLLVLFY